LIYTKPQLVCIVEAQALKHDIDPCIPCAIIEVISQWHPEKIAPHDTVSSNPSLSYNPQEFYIVASSIGLMQFTGLQARNLDYNQTLEELCEPKLNVEIGCKLLQQSLSATTDRLERALIVMYGYRIATMIPRVMSKLKPYHDFLNSPARPAS
jgi:hypothetical protein